MSIIVIRFRFWSPQPVCSSAMTVCLHAGGGAEGQRRHGVDVNETTCVTVSLDSFNNRLTGSGVELITIPAWSCSLPAADAILYHTLTAGNGEMSRNFADAETHFG